MTKIPLEFKEFGTDSNEDWQPYGISYEAVENILKSRYNKEVHIVRDNGSEVHFRVALSTEQKLADRVAELEAQVKKLEVDLRNSTTMKRYLL